ncbi:hypothetical protein ACFSFY_13940 [Sporosarcina siberiensis]|uniref:Uncharacterized protein n=1 Tax=Sporosarcina siberiensis TaxID=1365606 RepID=A0ABW4SJV3_9BACL
MNNELRVETALKNENELLFLVTSDLAFTNEIPSGKMITDSDDLSFVYLLEIEEGYSQVRFSEAVWPLMLDVLKSDLDPILSWGDKTLPLIGFKDELTMLIYNIEGNNNYGETFTGAVETAFKEILQNT